ncbi:hypothetical protein GEV33_003988 [Tenebrio molitor]|uniref:Uncharacterized protein n=1 Tax=Tenebrio molitor TaxID=7067 RepID=A0A8J6HR83_TENMO|nr:hypothetical protein GEV33_003988 [Tenebrio molitor]
MYTLLTMIEACLNSRPLAPLSNDPSDLEPLTPGHFLIGGPLHTAAEPDVTELPFNRLSRYRKAETAFLEKMVERNSTSIPATTQMDRKTTSALYTGQWEESPKYTLGRTV